MTSARTPRSQGMNHSGDDDGGSVEWTTPDRLYQPMHEVYDFTLDGAAAHGNAKCDRYCTADGTFGPDRCTCPVGPPKYTLWAPKGTVREDHEPGCSLLGLLQETEAGPRRLLDYRDGLNFPWEGERVFLNPPWGDVLPLFLRKVCSEHIRRGVLTASILPARTDSWFHDYVKPYARVDFRRGREQFGDPEAEERKARGEKARTSPNVGIMVAVYR